MKKSLKTIVLTSALLLASNTMTYAQGELKISDIKIMNNKELDKDFLLSIIPVKEGMNYTNILLNNIYLNLLQTELITEANIYPVIDGDNVTLTIEVDEIPNAAALLERNKEIINAQNQTDLEIVDVNIVGNKFVDTKTLLDQMPLKKGEFFVPINATISQNMLLSTGYFSDVKINIDRNAKNKTIAITFEVKEYPNVRSLNIEGNHVMDTEYLKGISGLKVGEPLNAGLLTPENSPILGEYRKKGIATARIEDIKVTPEGDVTIVVSEGIATKIEFTKVSQRKEDKRKRADDVKLKTKPYIFERLSSLQEGKIITSKDLDNTIQELYKTGVFTSIEPVVVPDPNNKDGRIVTLKLVERSTTAIKGSLSWDSQDGVKGGVELADTNFLGQNQNMSINASFGTKGNFSLEGSFYDPWIKGTDRLSFGISALYKRTFELQSKEKVKDNTKEDTGHRYAISGSFGRGINPYTYILVKPRLYGVYTKGPKPATNDPRPLLSDYTLFSVAPSIVVDTRDNQFMPREGVYLNGSYEMGYVFRDAVNKNNIRVYNKFDVDFRGYHRIYEDVNSMAYRITAGYANNTTPQDSLFTTGDGTLLRGFDAQVGNEKLTFTIENRTYVNEYLQLVAFLDAGLIQTIKPNATAQELANNPNLYTARYIEDKNNAKEQGPYHWQNFKKSFGVGARINTPIGVVRLDYSWPFETDNKPFDFQKGGKFSFGFGQTF